MDVGPQDARRHARLARARSHRTSLLGVESDSRASPEVDTPASPEAGHAGPGSAQLDALHALQAAAGVSDVDEQAVDEIFSVLHRDLQTIAAREVLRGPDAASEHLQAAGSGCSTASGARSSLGMIMYGLTIDNILLGGPAAACSALDRGDTLLKVDGNDVDIASFQELLRGSDQPGSLVTLTIMKGEESAVHMDSSHSLMPVLDP